MQFLMKTHNCPGMFQKEKPQCNLSHCRNSYIVLPKRDYCLRDSSDMKNIYIYNYEAIQKLESTF